MAIIDNITNFFNPLINFFSGVFGLVSELLILLFVILYAVAFFVVQYWLIKGYIFLGKFVFMKIPIINDFFVLKFFSKNHNKNENEKD